MGISERKERQKEELKKSILQVAGEILLEQGFEKLSMRKIADKINYSPTTIYLYFKDKNDLVFNIIEDFFAKFVAEFEKMAKKSSGDSVEDLKNGLKVYIENGLEFPEYYKIIFLKDLGTNINRVQHLKSKTINEQALKILEVGVKKCVQDGKFKEIDITAVCQSLWAAVHGLTSFLIIRPDYPWLEKSVLMDTLIDALLNGLRS